MYKCTKCKSRFPRSSIKTAVKDVPTHLMGDVQEEDWTETKARKRVLMEVQHGRRLDVLCPECGDGYLWDDPAVRGDSAQYDNEGRVDDRTMPTQAGR